MKKQYLFTFFALLFYANGKASQCAISGPKIVVVNPSSSYEFIVTHTDGTTPSSGVWSITTNGIIESQTSTLCKAKWSAIGSATILYAEYQVCSTSMTITVVDQNARTYSYDAAGNRITRKKEIRLKSFTETDTTSDALAATSQAVVKPVSAASNSIVDSIDTASKITIYPNPTKGQLAVEVENLPLGSQTPIVSIFNSQGVPIVSSIEVKGKTPIDITSHSSGSYFMVILVNGKTSTWNIIKEN